MELSTEVETQTEEHFPVNQQTYGRNEFVTRNDSMTNITEMGISNKSSRN